MPSIQYGNKTIEYAFLEQSHLKSHYITVERGVGVVLKGKPVSLEKSNALVLKKAKWVLEKLELVKAITTSAIVSGARMPYLGRRYYVELIGDESFKNIVIEFTASKFKVYLPSHLNTQAHLNKAFQAFYKERAISKITPRVKQWVKTTGLQYEDLKFMTLEKRWGSCTPANVIVLNTEAIKLPYSLIDYLIVHELVHTQIKNHSKEFWAEVAKILPNWKSLDERMGAMKL